MDMEHLTHIPEEALGNIDAVFTSNPLVNLGEGKIADPLFSVCQIVGAHGGLDIKPPAVRKNKGSHSSDLEEIAHASRMRVRRVMLTGNWWETDNGPLICFSKDDNQVYALIVDKEGRYQLIDPEASNTQMVTEENAKTLYPFAYSFYRTLPDEALSWKTLVRFASRGLLSDWRNMLGLQIIINTLILIVPIATGIIFDTVIPRADFSLLSQVVAGLMANVLVIAAFNISQVIAIIRLKFRINAVLQPAVWDRLLRLPLNFFRNYNSGDLATRIGGIDDIQQHVTGSVILTFVGGIFSVLTLGLIFFLDYVLALGAIALAIAMLIIATIASLIQLKHQRLLLNFHGKLNGLLLQLLVSISKLRVSNSEPQAFSLWVKKYVEKTKVFVKARTISINLHVILSVCGLLSSMLLFSIALARKDTMSFGTFIIINAAFGQFFAGISSMLSTIASSIRVIPLYERVKPVLKATPEVTLDGIEPGELSGKIDMQHITFSYPDTLSPAIRDVSIKAMPGEFVALVGASGAGKSTILRMLLRFEEPETGIIRYDDRDLAALNIRSVRKQLGVVIQNGTIIPGTILENINGFDPTLSLQSAWDAARLVGIDEDIKEMPMQLHTFVTENGQTFSVGQRQRLMLAKALVRRPKILLLDEATSALDNVTQALVHRNLARLGVTRIVSAHRLSTIVNANRIYVLEKGRIVQSGNYASLMKEKGPFVDLVKRQIL